MTTLNAFATLAEFKAYFNSRGGTSLQSDVGDDGVLEQLLLMASEHLEDQTSRRYVPYVDTRYFDVPAPDSLDPRELRLDDDLLEVISLTNGDGTTVPSTEYVLRQGDTRNHTPYNNIRLKSTSTYYWAPDSAGDHMGVIGVSGLWGYHNRYAQAWRLASTAAEAMDSSETGLDVASAASFAVGNLIRFDNELGYLSAIAGSTLTITRNENNSSPVSHLTGINVYAWQVMAGAKQAAFEIANQAKARRFGQSLNNTETITAGGVVLSPRDVPKIAMDFIWAHRRRT
jgi:hypothetical protein